jgi:biotin-dependent carboxylase-like uncharacterized protein
VLEILLGGLEVEFLQATVFALTGADAGSTLDGVLLSTKVSYMAHSGSRLEMGFVAQGLRAYVALAGGVEVPRVLGSRSTHVASSIGGVEGRALIVGDTLRDGQSMPGATPGRTFVDKEFGVTPTDLEIRVILGPQDDIFSRSGIETFLNSTYVVTDQSNRQGLRLDGPELKSVTGRYDIVSDAVVNGSIQVPGDGKPIIMLADRQTTGGYAKIATVASIDLPKLGQASPGASITFSEIPVGESQQLLAERVERFEGVEMRKLVDPISLRIEGETVSVGVADNGTAHVADVNGAIYPFSVEEHTPAE